MRIGIDATAMCQKNGEIHAGIGQYTFELIQEITQLQTPHTFFIYFAHEISDQIKETLLKLANSKIQIFFFSKKRSLITRHLLFPFRLFLNRIDVLFSPYGQLPFFWNRRSLIVVHDVFRFEHSEWFAKKWFDISLFLAKNSFHKTDEIIFISEQTSVSFQRCFPNIQKSSVVIPSGVKKIERKDVLVSLGIYKDHRFEKDFFLCLGTIEPRKNLFFAMNIFDELLRLKPELIENLRLYIVGKNGWGSEDLLLHAKMLNAYFRQYTNDDVVVFFGCVSEKEKWEFIAKSHALIFPSHDEGFGMPVLEAMHLKTPVLAFSNICNYFGEDLMFPLSDDLKTNAFTLSQILFLPEGHSKMVENAFAESKKYHFDGIAKKILERITFLSEDKQ